MDAAGKGKGKVGKGREGRGGLTFVHGDDVGVVEGGHDLNLPPDVDEVLLILDFVLPDGFDGDLWGSTEGAVSSQREKFLPPLFWEGAPKNKIATSRALKLHGNSSQKSEFYPFRVYSPQALLLHTREKLPLMTAPHFWGPEPPPR